MDEHTEAPNPEEERYTPRPAGHGRAAVVRVRPLAKKVEPGAFRQLA